jgi:hypothetical protein
MKHTVHLTKKEAHDASREYFDLHPDADVIIEEPRREFVNYQTSDVYPWHLDPNQIIEVTFGDNSRCIGIAKSFGSVWNTWNVMGPRIVTYRLVD